MESLNKKVVNPKTIGVFVQEMVPATTELIVGATRDTHFGPAAMFGLGRVFAGLLEGVTFRIAAVLADEARRMITEVKAYPLLKGYRNAPLAEVDAIAEIIADISKIGHAKLRNQRIGLEPSDGLWRRRKSGGYKESLNKTYSWNGGE